MDTQREAKRAYKDNPPAAGVYQILNHQNGKRLIGSWMNVQGRLNRERFSLEYGKHESAALQKDWNELGPEAFIFEVLDELKPAAGELDVKPAELKALEEMWIEKLQPFDDKGYNLRKPK